MLYTYNIQTDGLKFFLRSLNRLSIMNLFIFSSLLFSLVFVHCSIKHNPVKCVIFDVDGLLLDSETIYSRALEDIARKYNKIYTDDVRLKIQGTLAEDTRAIFIKELKIPLTTEELEKYLDDTLSKSVGHAPLKSGVDRLVNHLSENKIPIAVATSTQDVHYKHKIRYHRKLFDKFNHAVFGNDEEVKRGKPAPDIFLTCVKRFDLNLKPKDCLVFEDALNGMKAALSAGMQIIMIPDPIIPQEELSLATQVLSSMLDFKPEEFGLPPFNENTNST